ncbi:MAG: hypothetical protein PHV82_08710 [Victivallaceae bacterium]|nr:hypothetical protein [Victivallaceae bacterium]
MQENLARLISRNNLFGFNLIEHSSPAIAGECGENDINIRIERNPDPETDIRRYSCKMAENLLEMELPNLGRFRIENGNRITVKHNSAIDSKEILPFLYGACMGASLYQRGLTPLHGSAVATEKGAVLFIGASGSGKSTITAALINRGYQFICDDIGALRMLDGNPVLLASHGDLKLWKSALAMLDKSSAGLTPIRSSLEKYFFPVNRKPPRKHYSVYKIYILNVHNKESIELSAPLKGKEKFNRVKKHAYRKKFINGLNRQKTYFSTIMSLLANTEIKSVVRPRTGYFQELIDCLETDMLK